MLLTTEELAMLDGKQGMAMQKAMEILVALGKIYGAQKMTPVTSVQIAGVSYDNLGEAGLRFLSQMLEGGAKASVLATLNPAGMDVENWQALGISAEFAEKQMRVIDVFARMGIVTTCTCTPYLAGNSPHFGEHIAWAESSAVCYANSIIGARTNREGGPSALAAALTGRTPLYGYHLQLQRQPDILVEVSGTPAGTHEFGALGKVIGEKMGGLQGKKLPFIRGIDQASVEELKSLCASLATYGGAAMFHMEGITPEAGLVALSLEAIPVSRQELERSIESLNDPDAEIDFISLGCPHLSIREIQRLAELLRGRQVRREFWITTSRAVKAIADRAGFSQVIEASGAKFAVDTCCVVAPIRGRFNTLLTDSAKACYYAYSKNKFKTVYKSFDEVVQEALR